MPLSFLNWMLNTSQAGREGKRIKIFVIVRARCQSFCLVKADYYWEGCYSQVSPKSCQ